MQLSPPFLALIAFPNLVSLTPYGPSSEAVTATILTVLYDYVGIAATVHWKSASTSPFFALTSRLSSQQLQTANEAYLYLTDTKDWFDAERGAPEGESHSDWHKWSQIGLQYAGAGYESEILGASLYIEAQVLVHPDCSERKFKALLEDTTKTHVVCPILHSFSHAAFLQITKLGNIWHLVILDDTLIHSDLESTLLTGTISKWLNQYVESPYDLPLELQWTKESLIFSDRFSDRIKKRGYQNWCLQTSSLMSYMGSRLPEMQACQIENALRSLDTEDLMQLIKRHVSLAIALYRGKEDERDE